MLRFFSGALALIVLAPAAHAARVEIHITQNNDLDPKLEIFASGEPGADIFVGNGSADDPRLVVSLGDDDSFGTVNFPSGRCEKTDEIVVKRVRCDRTLLANLDSIDFRGGTGDDDVSIGTIRAPADLRGGQGTDRLDGGLGDDFIDVGPGRPGEDPVVEASANRKALGADVARGEEGNDTLRQSMVEGSRVFEHGGALLDGGPGDDGLAASSVALVNTRFTRADYILRGGPGNDKLVGGPATDVLHGEEGDDRLEGRGGADRIFAGAGADSLLGEEGDDQFFDHAVNSSGAVTVSLPESDVYDGGAGTDRVSYAGRTEEIDLRPNDREANDGSSGERDNLLRTEAMETGQADDFLFGVISLSDGIADFMNGGPGDDRLLPGDGDDTVTGGPGRDVLRAGTGDDALRAVDGEKDAEISCGGGTDVADIDLRDGEGTDIVFNCETVRGGAVDERPRAQPAAAVLRRTARGVLVPVSCARADARICDARVVLRAAGRSATARARVPRGTTRTVLLRLRAPRGAATATTIEAGRRGPRTVVRRVRLR